MCGQEIIGFDESSFNQRIPLASNFGAHNEGVKNRRNGLSPILNGNNAGTTFGWSSLLASESQHDPCPHEEYGVDTFDFIDMLV